MKDQLSLNGEKKLQMLQRSAPITTNKPVKKFISQFIKPYSYAESIVEAIHEPVIILDKYLTIKSANKAFYKTFKATKKTTITTKLTDFGKVSQRMNELITRLKALSETNTSFGEFELQYTFPKLGERIMLVNAKRILFDKQTTDLILISLEDITERKRISQQKDDFIAYVTHELKTPITSITAFVQILEGYHKKIGDKKSQFLLEKVSSQVARLSTLLNSFASVYRMRSGTIPLKKTRFNLNKLVSDVIEAFQYTTTSHVLHKQGEIAGDVYADKDKIHEVLANLISNAIKYSPTEKNVTIKLFQTIKAAWIQVKDDGVGIAQEEQQKVFERFFRVKAKREKHIEGLGLGLYLVSSIIKQHKGTITVKSQLGKGSTFSVSIPLVTR